MLVAGVSLVMAAAGPPASDENPEPSRDREERWSRLLRRFDSDGDGRLDAAERAALWNPPPPGEGVVEDGP